MNPKRTLLVRMPNLRAHHSQTPKDCNSKKNMIFCKRRLMAQNKRRLPTPFFYNLGSCLNLRYSGSAGGAVFGSKVVLVILAVVRRLIVCSISNLALSVALN
ncbi:MAG: hypothetical protein RL440_1158 [Bacteroidota bacterium]